MSHTSLSIWITMSQHWQSLPSSRLTPFIVLLCPGYEADITYEDMDNALSRRMHSILGRKGPPNIVWNQMQGAWNKFQKRNQIKWEGQYYQNRCWRISTHEFNNGLLFNSLSLSHTNTEIHTFRLTASGEKTPCPWRPNTREWALDVSENFSYRLFAYSDKSIW